MTDEFLNQVPSADALGERFKFIDNELLKDNVVIYFRYIIFLLNTSEDAKIDSLKYTLYKDIIIYTASIVESLLQYTVEREVLLGRLDKKVMGYNKKSVQIGKVKHDCNEMHDETIEVVQIRKYPKLGSGDRIDFKDITLAAKTGKIINESQYRAAEDLRNKRNTIHLSTLTKSSDDYFEKADVDKAFSSAHDIIVAVEKLFTPAL
jgi:hypothetical protein